MTNAIGESTFSISIWNIVNRLDKYDFSCGSAVNNLKERQLFTDQVNNNRFFYSSKTHLSRKCTVFLVVPGNQPTKICSKVN